MDRSPQADAPHSPRLARQTESEAHAEPRKSATSSSKATRHRTDTARSERVNIASVQPETVSWIWTNRIARGKFTVFDGDPGEGKSLLTLDLAARLSMALPLPEQETAEKRPLKTLFLICEDDLADTIAPRLIAAGAERSNIEVLTSLLQIPAQLDQLEAHILEVGAELVVMDPLNAYISGKVNTHNDHQVRAALTPLVSMAARLGVAVVGVRHLNKQVGGAAMYRGGGSIAYVGLARSAFLVGVDPDDSSARVLAATKGNLSTRPDSLRFRIVQTDQKQPRLEWLGPCDISADQLCAVPDSDENRSAAKDAAEFLREVLADGPRPAEELYKLAEASHISQRTLRRVRAQLRISKGRLWALPEERPTSETTEKAGR